MARWVVLAYGVACYLAFGAVFAALALFASNAGIVRGVDTAPAGTLWIDLAWIALFGVSHSVLARPWAKRALPAVIERSTYVLVASAALGLMMWQWRADPRLVWHVTSPALRALVWGAWGLGAAIALFSTFLTDHFDLFGLRQVWMFARGVPYTPVRFVERSLYRHVRHPMMSGLMLWLWATPDGTIGHLVFAAAMTLYIAIGVAFEERGLARAHGAAYEAYRERVPAFVPRFRRQATSPTR